MIHQSKKKRGAAPAEGLAFCYISPVAGPFSYLRIDILLGATGAVNRVASASVVYLLLFVT